MVESDEDWSGFAGISPESDKYGRIKLVFSSADFQHLKMRAIESRRRHETNLPPDIDCSIGLTQFAAGYDNLVLKLVFSDNVHWVARIPYRTIDDDTRTSMLSEIATMNTIHERTSIPLPRVFEFEMSTDGPFRYPYILMEHLGGRKLDGLATSTPPHYRDKVAKQLANVFSELQNLTFSHIGRLWRGETADQPVDIIPMAWHHSPGPLETSLEYFYNQRQGENQEIVALHPDNADWLTACWVLKLALAHIVLQDRVRGPFPLCHLDLHFGNLLFDDEYNLTGVIDWSNAQTAPLEQLSVSPELIIFPGRSEEENQPIVEFKNLVVQFVQETENKKVKEEETVERKAMPSDLQQGNTKQSQHLTPLSAFMASRSAEIMHRQYMASPQGSLWAGKRVAKLIYGDHITWEQLREVYGCMPDSLGLVRT